MKAYIQTANYGQTIPCTLVRAPFVPARKGPSRLRGGKTMIVAIVKGEGYRRVNADMTVTYGGTLCRIV